MLEDFARQVIALRQNFDGTGHRVPPQSEMAEGLLARLRSLLDLGSNDRAIRYRREVHPCRGALQLIKGDDRGDIDRCLRRDLKPAEIGRLERGGNCGTYVFWKCDSCEFRLKYFVTKSRAASLLQNDDHITFSPARLLCSRAFLAMSHLEQREIRRHSSSNGPPRYTCLICALHRVAARPGSDHTFFTREDYARHIEDTHIRANLPPAFVLHKLGIELGGSLPDGVRRELWTV